MKTFLAIAILLFAIRPVHAQSDDAKEYYTKGKKSYDDSKYGDAIAQFKQAIEEYDQYTDAFYYLGGSYLYNNQQADAVKTFEKLEQMKPDYWAYFYYWWGTALQDLNRLDEAKKKFETFLAKFDGSPNRIMYHHQGKYKLRYVSESPALRNMKSTMGSPVNLGPTVNSKWGEFMPQSDPTGKVIYFTSDRIGGITADTPNDKEEYDHDMYKTEKTENGWGTPQVLPSPINTSKNEGAPAISADGQTLIFVGCGRAEGIGSCDLYISTLEGTQWSAPKNMGNVVNSDNWDSQPTISSDGSMIIFTSDREGGYGRSDLYITTKNRFGDWSPPVNLGPVINTPFRDASPYLSPDGRTLYFSSAGHPGFGDADIFKTTLENGKWTEPVNLGPPLNSSGTDEYFSIGGSGEVGYFASNREGGSGDLDLYSIAIPEDMRPQPTVIVSGTVTSAKDHKPIGAWVLVEDLNTGDLIATNKSNSATGKYLAVLPTGKTYSVSANKDGFFFYSQKFEVPAGTKYQEITKDVELKPIEKGSKVTLNNVFFETGKAALSPDSKLELQKVIDLLRTNKTMVIEVGGHTDNVGRAESNMKLSHDRAFAVRQHLIGGGIPDNRVQAKGYGQTSPVASNDTPEGRAANRRTEIIILEY
jgi:outer membrane protein OmpA-like peptidoglycan-associated protein